MTKEKELLDNLVDAWESLEEGEYTLKIIAKWLVENMKPAVDDIRTFLGRPNEKLNKKGVKNENKKRVCIE